MNGNGQNSPVVQPAPLPTTIQVSRVQGADGKPFVLLAFMTPQGTSTFFLDLDTAKAVVSGLSAAAGGIMLPGPGDNPT